jgi:hypothetical protein
MIQSGEKCFGSPCTSVLNESGEGIEEEWETTAAAEKRVAAAGGARIVISRIV